MWSEGHDLGRSPGHCADRHPAPCWRVDADVRGAAPRSRCGHQCARDVGAARSRHRDPRGEREGEPGAGRQGLSSWRLADRVRHCCGGRSARRSDARADGVARLCRVVIRSRLLAPRRQLLPPVVPIPTDGAERGISDR